MYTSSRQHMLHGCCASVRSCKACCHTYVCMQTTTILFSAENATPRGFEPLRAEPNGFLVHHLSHSVTVSLTVRIAKTLIRSMFGWHQFRGGIVVSMSAYDVEVPRPTLAAEFRMSSSIRSRGRLGTAHPEVMRDSICACRESNPGHKHGRLV